MAEKKRKPNFTAEDNELIITEVEKNKKTLFSKLSNTTTNSKKQRIWDAITEKVNAVSSSGVVRSKEDVKKKWQDIQTQAKKKEAKRRIERQRTGAGETNSENLDPLEERVVGILGPTAIDGISGGIESGICLPPRNSSYNCIGDIYDNDVDGDEPKGDDLNTAGDLSEPVLPTPVTANARRAPAPAKATAEEHNFPSELLTIEKERLRIERRRLEIEEERLQMERERHNDWRARNGVNQKVVYLPGEDLYMQDI